MGSPHRISHSVFEGRPGWTLVERAGDLALADAALADAGAGRGALLLIAGPAGIGKTRLLAEVVRRARDRDLAVLRGRAGELERSFAYGVVRQLFEPVFAAASAAEQAELLGGAARLAAPVFDLSPAGTAPDADFGTLHGLFWLTANLAERRPLVLAVDDLHWCDAPSLRFVAYLARRLEGLPVLVAATLRPDEEGLDVALARDLLADPLATIVRPAPLSPEAVVVLVDEALGRAEPALAATVHAACAGNPLLLRELLRALGAAGVAATEVDAARVLDIGSRSLADRVRDRLVGLGGAAVALARAVAVLGDNATLRLAADLTAIDLDAADAAAEALVRADVLEARRPLRFVHPLVRAAVYAGMGTGERERHHAEAVRLLVATGAPQAEVAAHLLATSPGRVADAVPVLRDAAARAASEGAADAAIAYLRRALAEPLDATARAALLLDLGRAETRGDPTAAARDLGEALALGDDPPTFAGIAIELAGALFALGRTADAVAAIDSAIARVAALRPAAESDDLALRLDAELISLMRFEPALYDQARTRLQGAPDVPGAGLGALQLLALRASEAARTGEAAVEAGDLAERALEGGLLLEQRSWIAFVAAQVLLHLDRFDDAARVFARALDQARRRGSAFQFALASCFRSNVAYRLGDLSAAEADARSGAETALTHDLGWLKAMAAAALADVLLERGAAADALATLDLAGVGESAPGTYPFNLFLHTRGWVRVATGQGRAGLIDLLAVGERLEALGLRNPAQLAWRSRAACAQRALGETEPARRLAAEEVELARRWGAPRALGVALCARGLVEEGAAAIATLAEAVSVLETSPARLERARALTELGAALRRANHRADARARLAAALELADRCGASPLAERAHAELLAAGARPRRVARSGVDALTPSERRVAELAAAGQTNREIAQALFVTPRAIEAHLSNVYRKLDILARSQLARRLGASAS